MNSACPESHLRKGIAPQPCGGGILPLAKTHSIQYRDVVARFQRAKVVRVENRPSPENGDRWARWKRAPTTILRAAGNETFLVLAGVGEVVAGLRWWSFAQPPANRVRPLPGSKAKITQRGTHSVSLNVAFLTAQSIASRAPLLRGLRSSGTPAFPTLPPGENDP
jgi:hypothetical protein